MGFRTLNEKEVSALLGEQRVVRVGFEAADHRYLLPFAYIWLNGNLYGATSPGRKTRMTEQNAKVAFQVDNAQVPWEWQSVTGEGVFELITDPTEIARAEPVLHVRRDLPFPPHRKQGKRNDPEERNDRHQHIDDNLVAEELKKRFFHLYCCPRVMLSP